jgi:hypothetical protein
MSDPPPRPAQPPNPDAATVVVHRTWHDSEANLIAGMLRTSGIPCNTVSQVPHSVYPLTTDGLGEVRIIVAAEHAEEAQRRIARWRSEELQEGEDVGSGEPDPPE